jgi:hypothetical protein
MQQNGLKRDVKNSWRQDWDHFRLMPVAKQSHQAKGALQRVLEIVILGVQLSIAWASPLEATLDRLK